MGTRVAIQLDYHGADPWAETELSFELHSSHGSADDAHAWIVERLRAGPLELFELLIADGGKMLICPETVAPFARPPFALERLETELAPSRTSAHENGAVRRVRYRIPRRTLNGRTVLTLSPLELLEALTHLNPPPRVHRKRYHGVLAPNARLRVAVTAWAREATQRVETGSDNPPTLDPQAGQTAADPAHRVSSSTRSTPARPEPPSAAPATVTRSFGLA